MALPEIIKDIEARVKDTGDIMTGLLKTNGSIENQGEARFSHPTYCPNIEDTAVDIGCAFKASRGHFNQMNVNEIYLPATATTNYESNKILFKSYSGGNNGTYTGVSEIAQINTTGLKVGSSSIGINGYIEGTWLRTTSAGNDKTGDFAIIDDLGWIYKRTPAQVLSDIGAASKSHNHNSKYVKKSGDTMTGRLYIKVMDNQILLGNDEYKKTILRSDGSDFWLLVSDVGSNEFNDLRPFRFNLSSGQVYISHGLNITDGTFNYSSIQSGSSNANRNVWFSTSSSRGTPCLNDNFKYNPSTNTLTVGNITGNAATATESTYTKFVRAYNTVIWPGPGMQYFQGPLPYSTTAEKGKVFKGDSGDYEVFSAPDSIYLNGTATGNFQAIRFYWGTTYFREINMSPNNDALYTRNVKNGGPGVWRKIWQEGESITGAVWNDYAEYRESDFIEPGYCLIENGDDTLSKSTERMQPWAGISSDTWGFAQGQTEKAQTPIAVAGRVLVYPYRDRNEYKSGDCVCTAPDGKVDIMTEEEIYKHPDRIIGVVSCVPDYEEWGGGENADRPSVKVDGRIWVRVK